MNLRRAVPEDAMAVALVHVRAWQACYRGLMPDEYLSGLRAEDRARHYGFATVSPARDGDISGGGELCALYVEPDCWGRGIGRALASAARGELQDLGFRKAVLWVVAGNVRAEQFYRSDGWTADGLHRARQIRNVTVDTVRYGRDI